MKKITTILAAILLAVSAFAQAPQTMTYQAVVRNSSNALVQSSPVGMKVSILQGSATGTAVYVETHTAQTNENGLLDIVIGGGTVVSGTYQNGIFWAGGPYFLKTEIDPLGGSNYTITSTSEMLSVPFANYSHRAGALLGGAWDFMGVYTPGDPANGLEIVSYLWIVYLGEDKVSVRFLYDDAGSPPPYTSYAEGMLYGTILGNTITFPAGNLIEGYPCTGTGTKVGNNLSFTINDGFGSVTFNAIKQ